MTPTGKIEGAIFGQAIGDALGHPIEFTKGVTVTDLADDNKFTDDTQMFCAIGEALLEAPPHEDEYEFMEALSKRFIDWRKNPLGGNHRAPGGSCMEGVRKLGAKVPWYRSGGRQSKGNGTAMRSGIVGAMYWQYPDYAFRIGALSAVPTHNNLEAILAAGMVSYLVAASIKGISFQLALAEAMMLAADFENPVVVPTYPVDVPLRGGETGQAPWLVIAKASAAYCWGTGQTYAKDFVAFNGEDWTAAPALAAAVFFNARFHNYGDMVIEAVNTTYDCDTVGAITGTIAGARFGLVGIRQSWIEKIELHDYLMTLAVRIAEASKKVVITKDLEGSNYAFV
jgi:ADP-ribosyl-[dinitrogen reductase] hydrolase